MVKIAINASILYYADIFTSKQIYYKLVKRSLLMCSGAHFYFVFNFKIYHYFCRKEQHTKNIAIKIK